jgi:hypothetical protein
VPNRRMVAGSGTGAVAVTSPTSFPQYIVKCAVMSWSNPARSPKSYRSIHPSSIFVLLPNESVPVSKEIS